MKLIKLFSMMLIAVLSAGSVAHADLTYSQDFEGYDPGSESTLGDDGWQVGANVFESDGTFAYNYFSFPAPNNGSAFSGVATGEGGAAQGAQQLNTFSDYNNADHTNGSGRIIDALVFRDIGIVSAADVGVTYRVAFDVKLGNLEAPTETAVFLNTLDATSFANTGSASISTTGSTTDWSSGFVDFTINSGQVGNIFQLALSNRASNGDNSGIFYDNISITAVPEPTTFGLLGLAGLAMIGRRRRS